MNASLKQLAHGKFRKRHGSILRLVPPETCEQRKPSNQKASNQKECGRLPPDGCLGHVSV
jgi:hypothetical protein